jgi:hypothetical protein
VTAPVETRELSPSQRRLLRYWSLNVSLVYKAGWAWIPGFGYDPDDRRRIADLGAGFSAKGVATWLAAASVIYILVLFATMTVTLGAALTVIWPNSADMPASAFLAILVLVAAVTMAVGMPLSISWGGAIVDAVAPTPPPADEPADAALCTKIQGQFRRMGLILGGLLIISVLIWRAVLSHVG